MANYRAVGEEGIEIPATLNTIFPTKFLIKNQSIMTATDNSEGLVFENSQVSDGVVVVGIKPNEGGGASSGTAVRIVNSIVDGENRAEYLSAMINRSGTFRLFKFVGGSASQIGSTYSIPSFDETLEYTVKHVFTGTSHVCSLNGVERINETDDTNLTSTLHGARITDGDVQCTFLNIQNSSEEPTTPLGNSYVTVSLDTTDDLPNGEERLVNFYDLTSKDLLDQQYLTFTNGSASFDSYSIREENEVLSYAPDAEDLTATIAFASHQSFSASSNQPTQLNTILVAGPSTGCGYGANNILFTKPINGAFLFNNIPDEGLGQYRAISGDMSSLVKFGTTKKQKHVFEADRQSHGYGFVNKITQDRFSKSDINPFLWVNCCFDGTNITDMVNTELPYRQNMNDYITHANYRAAELALDINYIAISFTLGETGSDYTSFTNALRGYHDAILADIALENNQTTIPLLGCQTAPNNFNGTGISREEDNGFIWDYYQNNSDFYIPACIYYQYYHYASSDGLHMLAEGYTMKGEYEAIMLDRILEAGGVGNTVRVLEPLSYSTNGNVITVAMNVPVPPMVIDNTSLPALAGAGILYVRPDAGERNPTVTVSGNNLLIDIGEPPQENGKLIFGSGDTSVFSQMTNIRDSQNIASLVQGETLYNWCLCLTHTLTSGEV